MTRQASKLFDDIFASGCGGCERTCACGIHWFDIQDGWDWEEGELEDLKKKAAEDPEKYKESDGSVGTVEIDDQEIVYGCTCDYAWKYEQFIISHGRQIARYLNERAKALRETAEAIEVAL